MNFEIGYGFQNFSKVIAFDLNILVFVHTIFYGLISKIVSYNKWVILYRIELIAYFEPCQLDTVDARKNCFKKTSVFQVQRPDQYTCQVSVY